MLKVSPSSTTAPVSSTRCRSSMARSTRPASARSRTRTGRACCRTTRRSSTRRRAGARSPTSTATRASCGIAATRSSRSPSRPGSSRPRTSSSRASCRPTSQLQKWTHDVRVHTYVHTNIEEFLAGFRYDAHPMGMLLGAVGALSTFYPDAKDISDPENRYLQRVRLIAKLPTIAAFIFRHNRGLPYVLPRNDLDYVGNFVNMTFEIGGRHEPNPVLQRALEILLILHADHEQNCSTSAVRSVGSSQRRPVLGRLRRDRRSLRAAARRRQRGSAADARRDRRREQRAGVHRGSEGRQRRHPADGLRPPRLQELRPAGEADQAGRGLGLRRDGGRPEARDRARARADRARGRVLRQPQALSRTSTSTRA